MDPKTVKELNINQLNYNEVDWKGHYTLDRASFGQIMFTISRIKIVPKNQYEIILNSYLMKIIPELMRSYQEILVYENLFERDVFAYNLLGNLPKHITIFTNDHGKIQLKRANIGNLIIALYQRIDFILERTIPKMYQENKNYLDAFEKMRLNVKKFRNDVQLFEKQFIYAVDKAHNNSIS